MSLLEFVWLVCFTDSCQASNWKLVAEFREGTESPLELRPVEPREDLQAQASFFF